MIGTDMEGKEKDGKEKNALLRRDKTESVKKLSQRVRVMGPLPKRKSKKSEFQLEVLSLFSRTNEVILLYMLCAFDVLICVHYTGKL